MGVGSDITSCAVMNRNENAAKLNFAGKLKPVMFDFRSGQLMILSAAGVRHGISIATKGSGVWACQPTVKMMSCN